ncbi:Putative ABC exporter [Clostridium cavendishii DSM 21758]|uniref:Putative ABC exporter n=1 Tax=Clostridium cavendishii DSM 21758 TaxID=1121302 RepID=A0A1M6M237_9CLOT|nr:putative ABC exporter domain-containing protein [Clostridium cavendishii]SHJ77542.1 Putative ABC exporter [Clostridium cavendishii DSM 21758]
MQALRYLFRTSAINYIKVLKRTPSKLIALIFYIAILCFIFFAAALPKKSNNTISINIVISISVILAFICIFLALINGTKRMATSYLMSDVNLIFTSPIKPQTVLLYGFIKQIKSVLLFSLFLLFQMPNISANFKLAPFGIFVIIISFILLQLLCSFLSMLVYSLVNKSKELQQKANYFFKFLGIFLIAFTAISVYGPKNKLLSNTIDFFSGKTFDYVPIVGWFKIIITQCFVGYNKSFPFLLLLLIISIGITITILYKLNLDFYEDVLESSEHNETLSKVKTKQIDKKSVVNENLFKYKRKTRKITSNYNTTFARAIMSRHILEYRKTGFGILDFSALIFIGIALGFSFFFPHKDIKILLFFFIYMTVITSFTGKFNEEVSKHYIFMIPDRAEKKIIYATIGSILKFCSDALFIFIPSALIIKANPIETLLCILSYVSFGAVVTYGSIVNMRFIGALGSKFFSGLLQFVSLILYILPGLIGAGILSVFFSFLFGKYSIYISFLVWNSLASFVLLQIGKKVLDNLENV